MALGIVAAVLIAAPPSPETAALEARARVQAIYQMAEGRSATEIRALVDVLETGNPMEQAAALQAVHDHHRDPALSVVAGLMKSDSQSVRIEAAIRHHRWTWSPATRRRLEALWDTGASLRRAFQTGEHRGRPTFHETGRKFFTAALQHRRAHARLDAAVALVAIGGKARQAGLKVLTDSATGADPAERMLALVYMGVAWREPAFEALLKRALEDTDPRVGATARRILGRGAH